MDCLPTEHHKLRIDQNSFDCPVCCGLNYVVMKSSYYEFNFPDAKAVNSQIITGYLDRLKKGDVRKTHLFSGRYENVYIDREEIPALSELIPFWLASAAEVLGKQVSELRCGFWFNDMRPGDLTLPHSHDDYDEWLSGVYYLKVPENSGELVLHSGGDKIPVLPEEGKLVLFSSGDVHEVTANHSQEIRLSIGINFGLQSELPPL